MSTSASDQLLDMLGTIDETKNFLRKRCASGQAGQSMGLFEDLASLLELLDSRYRKSGYLPRDKAPVFGANADIIAAVRFLDAVEDWSRKARDKVKRLKVRQELARGGILEAAVREGKPFAQQAAEIAQFARSGSPEERAEQDRGISVAFSRESVAKARAAYEESAAPPAPAAPAAAPQSVPEPAVPEPPVNLSLDPAEEGARLFAGVRARSGARAMGARPMAAENTETPPVRKTREARPMAAENAETPPVRKTREARPMAAENAEAPPVRKTREARPMAAENAEAPPVRKTREARPMAAENAEAPPVRKTREARPMAAENAEAPPVRKTREARPMAPETGNAQPMGAPERPAAPETTTMPAMGRGVAIDRAFLRIFNEVGGLSEQELTKKLTDGFPKLENRYKMVICDQMRRFGYWGKLEPDRNEFEALRLRAQELCQHRDEYAWLYGILGDYRSRKTLLAILDNWYSYNFKDLSNMKEKMFPAYLDADLLRCTDDEVFADLGAGVGDVAAAFAEYAGHWKKLYCYEPHPGNFAALENRVQDLGLTEARCKAVGDKAGAVSLLTREDPLLSRIESGGAETEMVLADDDIPEPVSIIKMCLEGGEQAAIRGCSNHIHRDHPRLVLRADHGISDLWQLPRMIERLDKKYRFYLRHYGGNLVPMEYVLYAI